MSRRLLLDHANTEGGAGQAEPAATPPHPDLTRQPVAKAETEAKAEKARHEPAPERPAPPSAWEAAREAERKELAELRRWKADEEAKREAAERDQLRKAGDAEQLMSRYEAELKRRDEAVAVERQRYLDSTLDRDLAVALAKYPWVDGALDRVARLFRDELETQERDGRYHTIARETLRPIEDHLKDRIEKDPFFRHLLRAEGLRPGSNATDPSLGPGGAAGAGPERPARVDPALAASRGLAAAGRILPGGGIRF